MGASKWAFQKSAFESGRFKVDRFFKVGVGVSKWALQSGRFKIGGSIGRFKVGVSKWAFQNGRFNVGV